MPAGRARAFAEAEAGARVAAGAVAVSRALSELGSGVVRVPSGGRAVSAGVGSVSIALDDVEYPRGVVATESAWVSGISGGAAVAVLGSGSGAAGRFLSEGSLVRFELVYGATGRAPTRVRRCSVGRALSATFSSDAVSCAATSSSRDRLSLTARSRPRSRPQAASAAKPVSINKRRSSCAHFLLEITLDPRQVGEEVSTGLLARVAGRAQHRRGMHGRDDRIRERGRYGATPLLGDPEPGTQQGLRWVAPSATMTRGWTR